MSPVFSPSVFNEPTILAINNIPTNNFDGMSGTELLVSRIDLIKSLFVDQKVTIDWYNSKNGSMIDYFLFDILLIRRNTIIRNLEFLAFLD